MGIYFDSENSSDINDFLGKYIIMNDGYSFTLKNLVNENMEKK